MHNFWLTEQQIADLTQDQLAQSWLLERSSITLRLKSFFPNLTIKVLAEGFLGKELTANHDELAKLALDTKPNSHNQIWLRTVLIHNQGLPLVYGRTLIPNFTPENPWQQIEKLGNKPLGEVLFSDTKLQRSEFELSKFTFNNQPKLARRCVFSQQNQPLLLTEVFLNFIK